MQEVFRALERKSEDLQRIKKYLGDKELLIQLAEEAAELAQAATKYYRAIDGKNPTDVSIIEAEEHLQEEAGDVLLLLYTIGIDSGEVAGTIYSKTARWMDRLSKH